MNELFRLRRKGEDLKVVEESYARLLIEAQSLITRRLLTTLFETRNVRHFRPSCPLAVVVRDSCWRIAVGSEAGWK